VQLIADRIRCKPYTGKIPVIIGARSRPFFRMSKCTAEHLKEITINNPIQNSKFSNKSLSVYHQNIRGVSNKINELLTTVKNVQSLHILCLTEHHMKLPEILQVNLNNYTLGASFCRKNLMHGGLSIFARNSLKFNLTDIMHLYTEQGIECCAIRLESKFSNIYVLAIYRVPTGDSEQFISQTAL
jgi:hypothetical protein